MFLSLLKTMGDGLMCFSYVINSQIKDIKVSKYFFPENLRTWLPC